MKHGILQVKNGKLCDAGGAPVYLKGMSTTGLQWPTGHWILTDDSFDVLKNDWECDIIRLAMYIDEGGYRETPSLLLERIERGIELCTKRGMYVIVDWHVHAPGDPTDEIYLKAGFDDQNMPDDFIKLKTDNPEWTAPQVFFAYIAKKYAHLGNVLYEPANEPNRNGKYAERFDVWSGLLKPYYESIIDVIRKYDEKGIIICGTDNWSQYMDAPVQDPLEYDNIMYALHFYSGTHDTPADDNKPDKENKNKLRTMTDAALKSGLAVICTEWGISTSTGDGGPYIDYAIRWIDYMKDRGISWCAWSMSKQNEISAAFNSKTSSAPCGSWADDEVTVSGRFYRAMIKGDPVPMYTKDMIPATNTAEAVHNGDISARK